MGTVTDIGIAELVHSNVNRIITYKLSSKADTYNELLPLLSLLDKFICCGSEITVIFSSVSFSDNGDVLDFVWTSSFFCLTTLGFVETGSFFRVARVLSTGRMAALLRGTAVFFTLSLTVPLGTAFDTIIFFDNSFTSCAVLLPASAYKEKIYYCSHNLYHS